MQYMMTRFDRGKWSQHKQTSATETRKKVCSTNVIIMWPCAFFEWHGHTVGMWCKPSLSAALFVLSPCMHAGRSGQGSMLVPANAAQGASHASGGEHGQAGAEEAWCAPDLRRT